MNGWQLEVTDPEKSFVIRNPGADGKSRFFEIVPGMYSPMIKEEPELAITLGSATYMNTKGEHAQPNARIKGIIVKDTLGSQGKIIYRGNLTNFFGKDQGKVTSEGALEIEVGGKRYKLVRLVAENAARIVGYIGVYLPIDAAWDTGKVEVLDIQDLI